LVEGYELVEYRDPKGRPFWELTTSPANSQFQKMLTDPKKKLAARKMIDQISKIYDYGLKVASGTSKLRCIDPKIGLYELKGWRAQTWCKSVLRSVAASPDITPS